MSVELFQKYIIIILYLCINFTVFMNINIIHKSQYYYMRYYYFIYIYKNNVKTKFYLSHNEQ